MQALGSEEQAKKAVEEFLTAWQSGKSITDYMAGNNNVVIGDEDWQGGIKLVSFKISRGRHAQWQPLASEGRIAITWKIQTGTCLLCSDTCG